MGCVAPAWRQGLLDYPSSGHNQHLANLDRVLGQIFSRRMVSTSVLYAKAIEKRVSPDLTTYPDVGPVGWITGGGVGVARTIVATGVPTTALPGSTVPTATLVVNGEACSVPDGIAVVAAEGVTVQLPSCRRRSRWQAASDTVSSKSYRDDSYSTHAEIHGIPARNRQI